MRTVIHLRSRRGAVAAALIVLAVAGCSAPIPTLTPAPTPVATPKPARTATPTSGARIPIPASIDATGASDVSVALNSFVESVPDGSTIVFRAGAVYRLGQGLELRNRHDLTLEGNGATLRSYGDGHEGSSLLRLLSDRRITIHSFNLVGKSPTPRVYSARQGHPHPIRRCEATRPPTRCEIPATMGVG